LRGLARGLLAALILILLTSLPSYACERSASRGDYVVGDAELAKALETVRMARRAGWPEPLVRMAGAIAMAETRGYNERVGDEDLETGKWGPSVGLMQVRTLREQRGTGGPRDIDRIGDPLENMRAALAIYRGDDVTLGGKKHYEPGGFDQWSTYGSGAYKEFEPVVDRAAVIDNFLSGRMR